MTILKHQKLIIVAEQETVAEADHMTSLTCRKNIHVRREALKNLIQRS